MIDRVEGGGVACVGILWSLDCMCSAAARDVLGSWCPSRWSSQTDIGIMWSLDCMCSAAARDVLWSWCPSRWSPQTDINYTNAVELKPSCATKWWISSKA